MEVNPFQEPSDEFIKILEFYMILTLLTLAAAAVFFVWGKIRADVVALIALVVLACAGILTVPEALSGFSNPIVIMMAGLFVVGGAVFNSGLAKMIGARLSALGGNSPTRLFLVVVLATGIIGGFVSNTGTVALMMPIVVAMAASTSVSPARFLMPIAFASSIGGMLTLIGTPPNLVIAEVWEEYGGTPLTMFTFFPAGIVCLIVGTALLIPMSRLLVKGNGKGAGNSDQPNERSLARLVDEYSLNKDLWRIEVPKTSPINGLTLGTLSLRSNYGLDVLELRMAKGSGILRNVSQEAPTAKSTVDSGDILFVRGSADGVRRFVDDYGLLIDENPENTRKNLQFYDIGLAEIIPLPGSRILKDTVGDLDFRNRFNVNILGIRRGKRFISTDLKEQTVRKSDVLLVQGTWQDIARLSMFTDDWVVLGQPEDQAAKVTLDYKAPLVGFIMLAMIVALVFDFIPAVIAVIIAGLMMVLCGVFRNVAEAYKAMNWESIVLIAAMMPMSMALEKTGASELFSGNLVGIFGPLGPHWLLAGIYFATSIMTLFISNTATAVLLAPIALQSAVGYGVSPLPFLFAVSFGASLCFASPFSTPPNALVMSAGGYTFNDYLKVGAPLQIILGVIMIFVIPLIFPF